ncbi:MAG: MazG nucleotide pyrophosphohydrolase domain-containing protein [Planctomycetota bacterium]
MTVAEFQRLIEAIYFKKDSARGLAGTYMWFAEEVGELARALRRGGGRNLREEFADVFAWLSTLASIAGVELEEAIGKYAAGCPRCGEIPCACSETVTVKKAESE